MIDEQKLKQTASEIKRHLPRRKFILIVFETGESISEYKSIYNCEVEEAIDAISALIKKWQE